MAVRYCAGGVALAVCLACSSDLDELRARVAVEKLAEADGAESERAMKLVLAQGRRSIPHIEMFIHDATVTGRLNLLAALRQLGDVEGASLLAHRARRDEDERVRADALATLRQWARQSGPLAQRARAELSLVERAASRSAPR